MTLNKTLRFAAKIQKTNSCWNWIGALKSSGYGCFGDGNKIKFAHRLAWEIENGPIPNGLFVCHRCDNPRCVRPSHLFLGTNSENMKDSFQKGRSGHKGDKSPHRKLNESQVKEIRQSYVGKYGQIAQIARFYNVHHSTIWSVVKGKNWVVN